MTDCVDASVEPVQPPVRTRRATASSTQPRELRPSDDAVLSPQSTALSVESPLSR